MENPNARRVSKGDIVKTIDNYGYYKVCIHNKPYLAHRIIWLYVYGYIPENGLDHIDRNPANNRITNLREASKQCNARNSKISSNNSSGITGVRFNKRKLCWTADIMVNYKNYRLGSFADYIEAAATRLAAEQCLDWPDCDTKSTSGQCIKNWLNKINTDNITGN